MEVEVSIPFYMDQFFPETAFNTIRLLEKVGCRVLYNPQQTCCGQLAYEAGFWNEADELAHKFLTDFSADHLIVSPSPLTTAMVRYGYRDLDIATMEPQRCQKVQQNIIEITDFLVNVIQKYYFGAELEGAAMYCGVRSMFREYDVVDGAPDLLRNVLGLDVVPTDTNLLYSFENLFNRRLAGTSRRAVVQQIDRAMDLNVDYIISNESSCLLELQAYIEKHRLPLKTMHLVDVLTTGWGNI